MKKKVLFFLFFAILTGLIFGQTDVKKNYTKPWFQGNVRVADTLGIDDYLKFPVTTFQEDGAGTLIGHNTFGATSAFSFVNQDGTTVASHSFGLSSASWQQTGLATTGTFILEFANRIPFISLVDDGGGGGGFKIDIKATIPTANRIATFQDADGTIAYLSDIPTPVNLYTADGSLSGTRTVTIGANPLDFAITGSGKFKMYDFLGSPIFEVTDGAGASSVFLDGGSTVHSSFKNSLAVGQILSGIGAKLDVLGNVRFTVTGTETNGNVLQTDATGLGTWVNPNTLAVNNLYSADGSLAADRIVTMGANDLTFSGTNGDVFMANALTLLELNVDAGSGKPLSFYEPMKTSGGSFNIDFYADDDSDIKTLGASITARIGANSTPGVVNMDMVFHSRMKLQYNDRFLFTPAAASKAAVAHFEVRGLAGTTANLNLLSVSNGDLISNEIMRGVNASGQIQYILSGNGRCQFNRSGNSGGDFQVEGVAGAFLFYTDASQDAIGIGTNAPDNSALLDLRSTTKGFQPPSMTSTQRDAITSVSSGLMVYDNTNDDLNYYNGTAWRRTVTASASTLHTGGVLFADAMGSSVDNDSTNFFWDNSSKRLGIGTNVPAEKLEINGNIRFTTDDAEIRFSSNANKYIKHTSNTIELSSFSGHSFIVWDGDAYSPVMDITDGVVDVTGDIKVSNTIQYGSGPAQKRIELEIGDWDMNAKATDSTAHSLSGTEWATVRNVQITIRNDGNSEYFPMTQSIGSTPYTYFNSTNIIITRDTGNQFDSTNFDSTTYNRGWITFLYTPD